VCVDSIAVRAEMSTGHLVILIAISGCVVACLLGICKAVEKLAKGVFVVGNELKKLGAKLESVEAVSKDDSAKPKSEDEPDSSFEAIEAAISNFEKLKRIDLSKL
jgi:hypothetical protein